MLGFVRYMAAIGFSDDYGFGHAALLSRQCPSNDTNKMAHRVQYQLLTSASPSHKTLCRGTC